MRASCGAYNSVGYTDTRTRLGRKRNSILTVQAEPSFSARQDGPGGPWRCNKPRHVVLSCLDSEGMTPRKSTHVGSEFSSRRGLTSSATGTPTQLQKNDP